MTDSNNTVCGALGRKQFNLSELNSPLNIFGTKISKKLKMQP